MTGAGARLDINEDEGGMPCGCEFLLGSLQSCSGIAATVSSSTLNLTWSAATDNVGVAGHVVYRGTTAGLTADASSKIADTAAPSYADTAHERKRLGRRAPVVLGGVGSPVCRRTLVFVFAPVP